jgi:small subunit ribosomal protein S16
VEVKIRLKRMGTNKKPYYRIVVVPGARSTRSETLEEIGHYDPKENPPALSIEMARYDAWIAKGAKPSDSVRTLVKGMPAAAK